MTSSRVPVQQAEREQAVDQHARARAGAARRSATPGRTAAMAACCAASTTLVERALRPREARADREGAGHVGAVAAVLGAGVDQQQVAVVACARSLST